MPLLISRWIRQGVLNTALVLINFFFRTGFAYNEVFICVCASKWPT